MVMLKNDKVAWFMVFPYSHDQKEKIKVACLFKALVRIPLKQLKHTSYTRFIGPEICKGQRNPFGHYYPKPIQAPRNHQSFFGHKITQPNT